VITCKRAKTRVRESLKSLPHLQNVMMLLLLMNVPSTAVQEAETFISGVKTSPHFHEEIQDNPPHVMIRQEYQFLSGPQHTPSLTRQLHTLYSVLCKYYTRVRDFKQLWWQLTPASTAPQIRPGRAGVKPQQVELQVLVGRSIKVAVFRAVAPCDLPHSNSTPPWRSRAPPPGSKHFRYFSLLQSSTKIPKDGQLHTRHHENLQTDLVKTVYAISHLPRTCRMSRW
jgi:hypothetical protein